MKTRINSTRPGKKPAHNFLIAILVLALSSMACSMPGMTAPTPFQFPTATEAAIGGTPTTSWQVTATLPLQATATAPGQLPSATATTGVAIPTMNVGQPTAIPPTAIPPTNTRVPTAVSYAGPDRRKGDSIVAAYQVGKITVDGVFEEWNLGKYTVNQVVAGRNAWRGESDLSARVMWSWDEDYLYIAARVIDDAYVQNATGENLFKGDSLEILIDTDVSSDFYLERLNSDDYQLGISPGSPDPGDEPEAYLWYPQNQAGYRGNVKIGATYSSDGYRVETAIPWSTFGIKARSGKHFGIAFSVSDNDTRKTRSQESMVSSAPGRVLTNPTTWGDLTLSSTRTTVPTPPTAVPPPAAGLQAFYLQRPPTIDGYFMDWNQPDIAIKHVVYGAENWNGAADLSGSTQLGWDQTYLYFAIHVVDERYVQESRGAKLYLGDSLEILLDRDLNGDYGDRSLSSDDYQIGISPGRGEPGVAPEVYLWYPSGKAGAVTGASVAAMATGDGYVVEGAIPWSVFGIKAGEGQKYGFVFSISDDDSRNGEEQQTMVASNATRTLTNPQSWGVLQLK